MKFDLDICFALFIWELVETNYKAAGDVVIGWGKVKVTAPTPQGAPMEMVARYTEAVAEKDGKWVYLIDHASVPLPPPAPAAAK